jgi:hypothetical protein
MARALESSTAPPTRARSGRRPLARRADRRRAPVADRGQRRHDRGRWELSWYRFEVDLGDEAAGVRLVTQGTELSELEPADQMPTPRPTSRASCTSPRQHA